MKTSNFRNSGKDENAVAISRGIPRYWRGKRYIALAPSRELMKIEDEQLYTRRYKKEVLDQLDPRQVYDDLGPDAILLCWEAPGEFCHRRLVAEWLQENLGGIVSEIK